MPPAHSHRTDLRHALQYVMTKQSFKECLDKHDPHMVVSVHPLVQDVTARLLDRPSLQNPTTNPNALAVPFATVVTDLGSAHPMWFSKVRQPEINI